MLKISCPNCGAEVGFRSPALPARVCEHCQTILVRDGDDIQALGKAAVLPFDVSPVAIGMRGRIDEMGFEVIGRVRWGWTDGSWNEWLLLFDDGSDAWLGEAMGQFMLLRERPIGELEAKAIQALINGEQVPIGTETQIDTETFILSDAREAICLAAEGELPFTAAPGWTIFSADFRSTNGNCASLQRDRGLSSFYQGRYVSLAELAPRGMRAMEGWSMPAYAS